MSEAIIHDVPKEWANRLLPPAHLLTEQCPNMAGPAALQQHMSWTSSYLDALEKCHPGEQYTADCVSRASGLLRLQENRVTDLHNLQDSIARESMAAMMDALTFCRMHPTLVTDVAAYLSTRLNQLNVTNDGEDIFARCGTNAGKWVSDVLGIADTLLMLKLVSHLTTEEGDGQTRERAVLLPEIQQLAHRIVLRSMMARKLRQDMTDGEITQAKQDQLSTTILETINVVGSLRDAGKSQNRFSEKDYTGLLTYPIKAKSAMGYQLGGGPTARSADIDIDKALETLEDLVQWMPTVTLLSDPAASEGHHLST